MNEYPSDIVVAGAGSIGCFLGGALALSGRRVTLLARDRVCEELTGHGLHLTDYTGFDHTLDPTQFSVSADPSVLADADLILVTVKSSSTREMGALINQHARADASVVSFQNGVSNAALLADTLTHRLVLAGMVPFNVVSMGNGRFHRGTSGELHIDAGAPHVTSRISTAVLPVCESNDMPGVLWGKLLLNLNNALNALSGIPLQEQLESRDWRRIIADQMSEALTILRLAGIRPQKAIAVPPQFLPRIMRLPTPLFRLIAGRMLKIDPTARSSMWEDLQRGRTTEIEQLQGACVALAESLGMHAPICEHITQLIRDAEVAGSGSPHLAPDAVRRGIAGRLEKHGSKN